MNEKLIKKGVYITPELSKEWEKFHAPSKDYSPSAAAGMLLYMAADQPGLRELARKLACRKDIKKAIEDLKCAVIEGVADAELLKSSKELGPSRFFQLYKAVKDGTSGK